MNRRYSAIGLSNDGHLRVIALICAIALVGCAWIALEWLSKVDRTDGAPSPSSAATPASPPATATRPPATTLTVQAPPAPAVRENTLYKCTGGGRTVYADAPCGDRVETLVIIPHSAGLSPGRSYADQLAQVRAERARHAASQPAPVTSARNDSQAVDRCAAIDGAVRQIDAVTRQPLSIPLAEHYRARRKALMDERFSIACNG
jgi:hypothetical protein